MLKLKTIVDGSIYQNGLIAVAEYDVYLQQQSDPTSFAKVLIARKVISSKFPIGVGTKYKLPDW